MRAFVVAVLKEAFDLTGLVGTGLTAVVGAFAIGASASGVGLTEMFWTNVGRGLVIAVPIALVLNLAAIAPLRMAFRLFVVTEGGKPSIVVAKAYEAVQERWTFGLITSGTASPRPPGAPTVIDRPSFAYVDFENTSLTVDATRVRATITFFRPGHGERLFVMPGLWAGQEPGTGEFVDIEANGGHRTLNVALKIFDHPQGYGFNRESMTEAGWRVGAKALNPGTYQVSISLRGARLAATYWFLLTNPGSAASLAIAPVSPKDIGR